MKLSRWYVIFVFLLLVLSGSRAFGQSLVGNTVRLKPGTLPTVCNTGDLRINSADSNSLNVCRSNTWTEFFDLGSAALTASRAVVSDSSGILAASVVTSTELGLLSGLTSALCGITDSCTLTNKAMSGASNTFTNIPNSATTATSANTVSTIMARGPSGEVTVSTLSATTVVGALTGNVTGDLTGAVTGNASTATALAANPSDCGSNTFAQSIVASGALTCAAVSLATADTTGVLTVAKGGTGLSLGTSGGVLVSVGTTSFGLTGIGTTTQVLKGGAAPAFSQVALTTDVSGVLPVANGGTNNVRTASALFTSGTTTSQEYGGDWVNGNPANNSTGDNTISLNAYFAAAPNCTCTVVNDSNPNSRWCKVRTSSTSAIRIFTANTTDTAAAESFMLVCHGTGV